MITNNFNWWRKLIQWKNIIGKLVSKSDLMCSMDQKIRPGMEYWLLVQLLWRWSALENWTEKATSEQKFGENNWHLAVFLAKAKSFMIFFFPEETTNSIANHQKGSITTYRNLWGLKLSNHKYRKGEAIQPDPQ